MYFTSTLILSQSKHNKMLNVAFVIANIAVLFNWNKWVNTKTEVIILKNKSEILYAFAKGHALPLSKVNDAVFASLTLGKGMAIEPETGVLYSPCDGKVSTLADTNHAIAINTDGGAEVLLHIGIDTVNLKGTFFDAKVSKGKTVKKGDKLIEFNKDKISYEGYDTTICMAICNTDDYEHIELTESGDVSTDDAVAIIG